MDDARWLRLALESCEQTVAELRESAPDRAERLTAICAEIAQRLDAACSELD